MRVPQYEEDWHRPERAVREGDHRLRLTWEVPASCNMRPLCPYCNNAASRAQQPALPPGFAAIVDGLARLGEERGPLYLSVCYGEPLSHQSVIDAIGRLGRRNLVDVSTNLLATPDVASNWPRNGNIRLVTSWHPHRWPLSHLLDRRREWERAGIACGLVTVVAWPPYLPGLHRSVMMLRALGVDVEVLPFHGEWAGAVYPAAYTDWERAAVEGLVSLRHQGAVWQPGRLCRAGHSYAFVRFDGIVQRCYVYGSAVLGDVRQHVRLLDSPAQCESPSCPCPDMWQMLD